MGILVLLAYQMALDLCLFSLDLDLIGSSIVKSIGACMCTRLKAFTFLLLGLDYILGHEVYITISCSILYFLPSYHSQKQLSLVHLTQPWIGHLLDILIGITSHSKLFLYLR